MNGKTHFVFGLLLGMLCMVLLSGTRVWFFLPVALFFSIFPDIDTPFSSLGRKSRIVSFLFKHRGLFHSILALALFVVGGYVLLNSAFSIAVLVGYGSHLLLDMTTKQGILLLHPFHFWHVKGNFKTGGWQEYILMLIFVAGIFAVVWFNKNIFIPHGVL